MRFAVAAVFAALLLPTPALAEGNVPPSMLRISGPATVYAPAVRVDPPGPQPVFTVDQLIRDIWPDQLEDRAIAIAKRESGPLFKVDAVSPTRCCFGVFQIYFTAHRSWLDDYQVFVAADLFDPVKNVTAAYHLYELDGWTPWTCC